MPVIHKRIMSLSIIVLEKNVKKQYDPHKNALVYVSISLYLIIQRNVLARKRIELMTSALLARRSNQLS